MKKAMYLLLLCPMIVLLTGCPVGTKYPLENPGTEKIDKKLIGTWENKEEDPEARKVTIKQADDYSYDVEVFETGSMYMPTTKVYKAWITTLEGKNFFYLKPDNEENYYLYCYEVSKKSLTTWDVGLKVGGIDAVTSIQAFRDEVKASLAAADCLSGAVIWSK
ncbi:MAG: hypothetical protein WCM76_11865 [Bacteroidota bacterium]